MFAFINFLNRIFDLFFYPFESLHPFWGLCAISLLTGIFMLIIYRYTSDQEGIKKAKDKIKAYLFEIRLYRDDLGIMLDAQKKILRHNLTYMMHSLRPLAVMIIPLILLLINMNFRFGYEPLKPGESSIVILKLHGKVMEENLNVSLNAPEGIEVLTPALKLGEGEVDWKIRAEKQGEFSLEIEVDSDKLKKKVVVSDRAARLSPRRVKWNIWDLLLYPGEPPLQVNSPAELIEIKYKSRQTTLLGINIHWLIIFFVLSIFFGFALKGWFRVEI